MGQELLHEFDSMRGKLCWGVHWDIDTGFRLNFGEPHLDVTEPVAEKPRPGKSDLFRIYRQVWVLGDWVFWIDPPSYWKTTFRDIRYVTSNSPYNRIRKAEVRLDGQRLESVSVERHTGATQLVFDRGQLEVRAGRVTSEYGLWDLRTPDGTYITVHSDGTFSRQEPGGRDLPRQSVAG